jgi:hypothetical protein
MLSLRRIELTVDSSASLNLGRLAERSDVEIYVSPNISFQPEEVVESEPTIKVVDSVQK